jgi:hypothetical protein
VKYISNIKGKILMADSDQIIAIELEVQGMT